jgi:hypothetical protein
MRVVFEMIDQIRWARTEGLIDIGQQEMGVPIAWSSNGDCDGQVIRLFEFIEAYLKQATQRIGQDQTIYYGWTTLRFKKNESSLAPCALVIEELHDPLAENSASYQEGVTQTIALMRLQESALKKHDITGIARYPHRSYFGIICDRVDDLPLNLPGGIFANRSPVTTAGDSGWFIGCVDKAHDHNDPNHLQSVHLRHLVMRFPAIFPYLAMPEGTAILFEHDKVVLFRPREDEGIVDANTLFGGNLREWLCK